MATTHGAVAIRPSVAARATTAVAKPCQLVPPAAATCQVPDEATRSRASDVVKSIPDVRTVFNELTVSGITSLTSDANDVALTSQVKARMLRDERVPGTKIKVVTEAGVVYLMGLVTKTEAEATTDIARTTSGVAKVVTLFEYLN